MQAVDGLVALLDSKAQITSIKRPDWLEIDADALIGAPVEELVALLRPTLDDSLSQTLRSHLASGTQAFGLELVDDEDSNISALLWVDPASTTALLVIRQRSANVVLGLAPEAQTILNGLQHGVAVILDDAIAFINVRLAKTFGYTDPAAAVGRSLAEIIHPDELDEARTRFERALDGRYVPGAERRVLRHDGEVATLALSPLCPIEFQGRPAVLISARDVTQERQLEARLRLADRLTSVGTLAAGVAHEVNNPLASVVANLSILGEEMPELVRGLPEDEAEELIDIVSDARHGADRVQQIVRDLSTFAKVDTSKLGHVDVNRSILATLNITAPHLRPRARVTKDLVDVPPVRGNEARLGQVLLHLVMNAAQAMPTGRAMDNQLIIKTYVEGDSWVCIDIEDTGAGMTEEVRQRIFEPFFTTKPVGEGIGLGLAITHSIVIQMGGDIQVESEPNRGTIFRVRFPALPRARISRVSRNVDGSLPAAEILVVDDEPMITKSLERLLKGHTVTVARSGREALELLDQRPFDLIVCDLIMPDLTGMDVYEELRRSRPGQESRIVFITGGAFTPRSAEFLENVPNIWIEKPFDAKTVRALLDLELRGRA